MQYRAIRSGKVTLILDTEQDDMGKYDRVDAATVAARRRADILAGRDLIPSMACHYCGAEVGKGALWCSTDCAKDYAAERKAVNSPAA